jgi:hypothetical protein
MFRDIWVYIWLGVILGCLALAVFTLIPGLLGL